MFEPVSVAAVSGYAIALSLTVRTGGAISTEASLVRASAARILESRERSIALFGAKSLVIDRIHELAADEVSVLHSVINRASDVVRALPDDVPLPDVAVDPDGSISFDWISSRTRVFSLSVGESSRVAFAWIDGTDRGHGVARFERDVIPSRVLAGIREVMSGAAVRVA